MDEKCEILVVDDVEAIRTFIRMLLVKLEFEHIDTSSSGQETMEKLRKKNYHLIFLDINLPGADGLSLLRYIRDKYPDSKVVMCTGNSTEENVKEAIGLGAVGFLAKPVTATNFVALLDRLKIKHANIA